MRFNDNFLNLIKDNCLYDRGSTDDSYAIFSYISAIKYNENLNGNHGKISIIIEGAKLFTWFNDFNK